jgi:hypothetical protein
MENMMNKKCIVKTIKVLLILFYIGFCNSGFAQDAEEMTVVYDKIVSGFAFPESVAYDPVEKMLYVGQFGSVLKPALKDGKGKISKVALNGKVLKDQFLPGPGDALNKPKGIWIEENRLWVADIDEVWVFDIRSRRGKKLAPSNAKFLNDVTVINGSLFISDTAGTKIYKVMPADFLESSVMPEVTIFSEGLGFRPNGLFPGPEGSLVVVGNDDQGELHSIYVFDSGGEIKALSGDLGSLDGVGRLSDGTLLVTDWKSKTLFGWSPDKGTKPLAKGFSGPADFCMISEGKGMLAVVPDLVKGELRIMRIHGSSF